MRTYEEVKDKMLMLRDRYLKERIEEYTCRKPVNCIFSHKAKIEGCGKCMLCTKTSPREFIECSQDKCVKCADFVCKNTEESVAQDFNSIVNNPTRCAQEYPKLAILLWFLQDCSGEVPEKRHFRWLW